MKVEIDLQHKKVEIEVEIPIRPLGELV